MQTRALSQLAAGTAGLSSFAAHASGAGELERLLANIAPSVASALHEALSGRDISAEQGAMLLQCGSGAEIAALAAAADELRRRHVGPRVTYVVNRNINFTNVCVKRCGFCAFSRGSREGEGYWLPVDEVVRRAREAHQLGATEVCVQAGLPPRMPGDLYERICVAIKDALPDMHIHGFSPEEVLYGAKRSGATVRDFLLRLRAAGVGSLPGTSAEILDQRLRDVVSPGRISVENWKQVITTAHELGIPTTSTMMFGFAESAEQVAAHLDLLRGIQRVTGGFTEFVPLSYVHSEAPMSSSADPRRRIAGVRRGPSGADVLKVHAVARLMLSSSIPNLQVSWVKEGPRMAQLLLNAGVNDLGGTLLNESISTAAGARHGQRMYPADLRALIRGAGPDRVPVERHTGYAVRRIFPPRAAGASGYGFDEEDADREEGGLDALPPEEAEARFGSFHGLVRSAEHRYSPERLHAHGHPPPPPPPPPPPSPCSQA
eukprot:tig00021318_g20140.t1